MLPNSYYRQYVKLEHEVYQNQIFKRTSKQLLDYKIFTAPWLNFNSKLTMYISDGLSNFFLFLPILNFPTGREKERRLKNAATQKYLLLSELLYNTFH